MLPRILNSVADRMAEIRPSRRHFLLAATATATGLAIGFRPAGAAAPAAGGDKPTPNPFAAYLTIDETGKVTVLSSQFDMGQGSYHGLATLVVEELGADWSQVDVVGANGNLDLYGNLAWGGVAQGSGGSTSIATSWDRYRKAGAAARMMLTAAAARAWQVPASEIRLEKSVLSHEASGRSAPIGEFAAAAAAEPVPTEIPLKPRSEWTQIGNPDVKRYDRVGKTRGEQDFTLDVMLPGQLTAVMIHPPKFGATVASFDATEAKQSPGVVDVVAIHRGVAVVAKDMWSALKARDLVTVDWDESQAETRGSKEILDEYEALAEKPAPLTAREEGDVASAMAGADKVLEATFRFPYLAHAAMEPLNAVARMNEDGTLEVWGGHQMPDLYAYIASQVAGTTPDKVRMHIMKTGGGFGRRAVADGDVISEAVAVAKAIGWQAPVKVQWTRENDMRGGRYRPAYVHRMKAGLDADGNLVAWEDHIVGQSIVLGTPFEGGLVKDGVDVTSVEGAANLPYHVPNMKVGLTTTADVKVPVLWWRSVGSTQNGYATEVFIDEVAEAAGKDPVQFRLDLLTDHPRHAAVLKLAAEKAGWGKDLPEGHHLGVSVHESFHSFVAEVAEISMEDGEPRVHKVVAAADVGTVVNPDTVIAQIEGGIGFGLGAILQEEITLENGEVVQGNYDTYTPLRIDRMPKVEVHLVESEERPTGIGEPGVPPIGPAVANAIAKATGRRVRTLPINKGMTA